MQCQQGGAGFPAGAAYSPGVAMLLYSTSLTSAVAAALAYHRVWIALSIVDSYLNVTELMSLRYTV